MATRNRRIGPMTHRIARAIGGIWRDRGFGFQVNHLLVSKGVASRAPARRGAGRRQVLVRPIQLTILRLQHPDPCRVRRHDSRLAAGVNVGLFALPAQGVLVLVPLARAASHALP